MNLRSINSEVDSPVELECFYNVTKNLGDFFDRCACCLDFLGEDEQDFRTITPLLQSYRNTPGLLGDQRGEATKILTDEDEQDSKATTPLLHFYRNTQGLLGDQRGETTKILTEEQEELVRNLYRKLVLEKEDRTPAFPSPSPLSELSRLLQNNPNVTIRKPISNTSLHQMPERGSRANTPLGNNKWDRRNLNSSVDRSSSRRSTDQQTSYLPTSSISSSYENYDFFAAAENLLPINQEAQKTTTASPFPQFPVLPKRSSSNPPNTPLTDETREKSNQQFKDIILDRNTEKFKSIDANPLSKQEMDRLEKEKNTLCRPWITRNLSSENSKMSKPMVVEQTASIEKKDFFDFQLNTTVTKVEVKKSPDTVVDIMDDFNPLDCSLESVVEIENEGNENSQSGPNTYSTDGSEYDRLQKIINHQRLKNIELKVP